jgi:hypothetical protein
VRVLARTAALATRASASACTSSAIACVGVASLGSREADDLESERFKKSSASLSHRGVCAVVSSVTDLGCGFAESTWAFPDASGNPGGKGVDARIGDAGGLWWPWLDGCIVFRQKALQTGVKL